MQDGAGRENTHNYIPYTKQIDYSCAGMIYPHKKNATTGVAFSIIISDSVSISHFRFFHCYGSNNGPGQCLMALIIFLIYASISSGLVASLYTDVDITRVNFGLVG